MDPDGGEWPPKLNSLFKSVDTIPGLFYGVIVFTSVIMLIIAGYMWMMSEGDPQKVKQAQGIITWVVIGLIFSTLVRVIIALLITEIQGLGGSDLASVLL